MHESSCQSVYECGWERRVKRLMMTSGTPLTARGAAQSRKGARRGCREGTLRMSQDFVRYSPDVERADPTFEQSLQTVLENMKRHMRASYNAEGIGRVVRDAHAKGYGLARGEVEILSGLPTAYAQGIYARPGRHEAMVRFSNGRAHVGADAPLGAVCGIGLKLFDVEGRSLLEDEPDSRTFDYAM